MSLSWRQRGRERERERWINFVERDSPCGGSRKSVSSLSILISVTNQCPPSFLPLPYVCISLSLCIYTLLFTYLFVSHFNIRVLAPIVNLFFTGFFSTVDITIYLYEFHLTLICRRGWDLCKYVLVKQRITFL